MTAQHWPSSYHVNQHTPVPGSPDPDVEPLADLLADSLADALADSLAEALADSLTEMLRLSLSDSLTLSDADLDFDTLSLYEALMLSLTDDHDDDSLELDELSDGGGQPEPEPLGGCVPD